MNSMAEAGPWAGFGGWGVFAALALVFAAIAGWLLGRAGPTRHGAGPASAAAAASPTPTPTDAAAPAEAAPAAPELGPAPPAVLALLDGWHWRTNAGQHLVHLAPGADAPPAPWDERAFGLPLQSLLEPAGSDREALARPLAAQSRCPDLAVKLRPPGAAAAPPPPGVWLLRAVPLFAADGRFAGHAGTLRPATAPAPGAAAASPGAAPAEADDVSTLTFTVSHDLRAPLRVVEGFTRIVKEDYGSQLDRVANDHLDRVLGATARMNAMIDALLTMARLATQPLARQPVNLSLLATHVAEELRRQAPERPTEFDIEPGLATIGDPTLLRMVLENLLGNAFKYSARAERPRVVLAAEPHGGGRAFVVRDNGAGFDMRGADRLFGLFQRLHSQNDFPGTGVGLASVQRVVRRHGGEVWAVGEPGRGAAFHFTLPEAQAAAPR
jgi:signal transduction histidine kinase